MKSNLEATPFLQSISRSLSHFQIVCPIDFKHCLLNSDTASEPQHMPVHLHFNNSRSKQQVPQLPKNVRSKKIEKLRIKEESHKHSRPIAVDALFSKPSQPVKVRGKQPLRLKLNKVILKNDCRFSGDQTTDVSSKKNSTVKRFDFETLKCCNWFGEEELLRFQQNFDLSAHYGSVDCQYLSNVQRDLTAKTRAALLNWMLLVNLKFGMCTQTFMTSVNLFDQFCSKVAVPPSKFQLLGLTCLFIAAKFEEVKSPKLPNFLAISNSQFSASQVIEMEAELLSHIGFRVSTQSPLAFLELEGALLGLSEEQLTDAKAYLLSCSFDLRMCNFDIKKVSESCIRLALNEEVKRVRQQEMSFQDQSKQFSLNSIDLGDSDNVCQRNVFLIGLNLERAGLFAVRKLFSQNDCQFGFVN